MSEQNQAQADKDKDILPETFSLPVVPDGFLQDLVTMSRTRKIPEGALRVSVPVLVFSNGLVITGETMSTDEWFRWYLATLDKSFRAATITGGDGKNTNLSEESFPDNASPLDGFDKKIEKLTEENADKPKRFMYLKNVRVCNNIREIEIKGLLRLRLDSIDGWTILTQ